VFKQVGEMEMTMNRILRDFLFENTAHFFSGFTQELLKRTGSSHAWPGDDRGVQFEGSHYEVLGVNPSATHDEIIDAFRREIKQWHPDVNNSPEAAERSKQIIVAHSILRDRQKRAQYDEYLRLQTHAALDGRARLAQEERIKWQRTRETIRLWENSSEINEMASKTLGALLNDCMTEAGRYTAAKLSSMMNSSRKGG
jgi:DnaJ-class molecular chaperone